MSDQIIPGHFYRRHDGEIVGPATTDKCREYEIEVGGHYYNGKHNGFRRGHYALRWTLLEDLGTVDPRLAKKPRKAPAKKFRKVRMWFVEVVPRAGDVPWFYVRCAKEGGEGTRQSSIAHGLVCGPLFSQIINVPIPSPKKPKGKK